MKSFSMLLTFSQALSYVPYYSQLHLTHRQFDLQRRKIEGHLSVSTFSEDSDDEDIYTKPLVNDIERLSTILSDIVQTESKPAHDLYEQLRNLALARSEGNLEALDKMKKCAQNISPDEALSVTRAFTQALNLINAAEVHHRMRYLREVNFNAITPLPLREDSVAGTIENILYGTLNGGPRMEPSSVELERKKEEVFNKFLTQKIEIVYTAHPTEVNRRTLLRKYRYVSEVLATLDRRDLSLYERMQQQESLRRVVASIWGSDEIRREKPTPQQEAKGGLAILESVLWDAVPSFFRRLSAHFELSLGRPLPLTHTPIQFASWMGGDRDGNPNVTPQVTFEVALSQRMQAARLHLCDIDRLYGQLAVCKGFSPEMLALAREVRFSPDKRELYRRVIGHLQQRLLSTLQWCDQQLALVGKGHSYETDSVFTVTAQSHVANTLFVDSSKANIEANADDYIKVLGDSSAPILDAQELLKPLTIMHESLCKGGYYEVADGLLVDIIRRVSVFGITLCPLDLRQESGRHTLALDAITRYLGIGSYAQWDEITKLNWLQNEISSKRPLFRASEIEEMGMSAQSLDTLKTIEIASTLGPGSLGAYVISQARCASDVLAVTLLQKQYGMTAVSGKMLRVVPLFETLNDLTNAPKVMETLFSIPNYLGMTRNKHEIMIGYSDSAKDAGRLSAGWAQYESQEKMVRVADRYGVELTFFHGKGGTVGRGGNPALYRAVLAHPPRTINGRFRVTEQGEMITQNFGSTGIAERTMDIYIAAVLAEQFFQHVDPKPKWRKQMERLSEKSCAAYQGLVAQRAFVQYFRKTTPELELGSLNIGSRPAKRNPDGGIESLRAIPWTFAWSQIRLHMPAWYGVGEALDSKGDEGLLNELREMYEQWPFFRETIDLIAMTLSKADRDIAGNYESLLVDPSDTELKALGNLLRQKLELTVDGILRVTGADDLSCNFRLLQRSMKTRYPYVDPLNVLQAEMLQRLRSLPSPAIGGSSAEIIRSVLEDTIIVSINGISQGMKNSG